MRLPPELERRASRQCGVFSRADARAVGVSAKRERQRVRSGLWVPVLGSAYVEAQTPIGPWQRASAASLLTGGFISHLSAAVLQEVPVVGGSLTHLWVPPHANVSILGIRPHHGELPDADVESVRGVLMTRRGRTIVDCLASMPWEPALTLARDVAFRRWITITTLQRAIATRPGRKGTPQLTRLVAQLAAGGASEAELRLHALLRRAGIRGWLANQILHDLQGRIGEVDVVFPEWGLVIEVDGFAVHGGDRRVFQRDRTKQNRLMNAGYVVLRFTWADLVDRGSEVIATIRDSIRRVSER